MTPDDRAREVEQAVRRAHNAASSFRVLAWLGLAAYLIASIMFWGQSATSTEAGVAIGLALIMTIAGVVHVVILSALAAIAEGVAVILDRPATPNG